MRPKEIDEALGKLGSDGDKVRGTIERESSPPISRRRRRAQEAGTCPPRSTLPRAAGKPLIMRYGKQIVDQLTTADPQQLAEQLDKVRARRPRRGSTRC